MSHSLRSRVFLLECTVALAVSSLLWLLIAPALGAARLSNPWSSMALIIGYSVATRFVYKLGIPACMLISAGFNAPMVLAAFLGALIGIPYAVASAAALLPGVHVASQLWLVALIFIGTVLHSTARAAVSYLTRDRTRRRFSN